MTSDDNHFTLFGLPAVYRIDLKALDSAYERLTLEHHPDLVATADDAAQAAAQRASARVNEAYRVLRSERRRAAYLLGLLANGHDLNTTELPPGFLQEMFLLQEELDELDGNEDGADGQDGGAARTEIKARVDEQMAATLVEREALFAKAEAADAAALQAIQSNLNREKYLQRLQERLD